MTFPGGNAGEAFIQLHVDDDLLTPEMKAAVEKSAEEVERTEGPTAGGHIGKGISSGIEKEVEKPAHGRGIAKAVERSVKGQHASIGGILQPEENEVDRAAREVAHEFVQAFEEVLTSSSGGSNGKGPFSFITEAIRDAIGAGFNISGKSPLIAFLVPLFGAIANVIGSALVASQGLLAVLYAFPTALAAIGLEVGTLFFAFRGLGDAISGAFAAKNAKEFQDAISGLTINAQQFLTKFVPEAKNFLDTLSDAAQRNFFWKLGSVVLPGVVHQLTRELLPAVSQIASAFGSLAEHVSEFFATSEFTQFLKDLLPAIIEFIFRFDKSFVAFLSGLTKFADSMIPFLRIIGHGLTDMLTSLGDALTKLTTSQDFQDWLASTLPILQDTGKVFSAALAFIVSFFDSLNQAGGESLLTTLSSTLLDLAAFFSSPVGIIFLRTLIELINFLTRAFEVLVISIGSVISLLGAAWDGVKFIAGAIADWFTGLGDKFEDFKAQFKAWIDSWVGKVTGFPHAIADAIGDLGKVLLDSGKQFVQGFIDGISSKISDAEATVKNLVGNIRSYLPFSPAKKGPLSGAGSTYVSGQKLVSDLSRGMNDAVGSVSSASENVTSSIVFGPGSIRVAFEGSEAPTFDEARMTGSAVGEGISQQLADREAQLAVRTL